MAGTQTSGTTLVAVSPDAVVVTIRTSCIYVVLLMVSIEALSGIVVTMDAV